MEGEETGQEQIGHRLLNLANLGCAGGGGGRGEKKVNVNININIKSESEVDGGQSVSTDSKAVAAVAVIKKEHSIKVPRLYKEASKGLGNILDNGHGLKNAVYSRKHPNIKGITALVTETLKHSAQLDYILQRSKILEEEPNLNKCLAQILTTELIWGKKRLGGEAKPILTVLKYENKLRSALERYERKHKTEGTDENVRSHLNSVKPRYVRVNTIRMDLDSAIAHLVSDGWTQVEEEQDDPNGFYVDSFVPNLLVFPIGTQFQAHPLYLNGSLILQDKASCLPALALKPRRGRCVMDACAAPGMKTSLLAAMMEGEGRIFAIEKAVKRHETLMAMMEHYGVGDIVRPIRQDFTNINPEDYEYKETEFILVDPSCSGSGMSGRIETDLRCWSHPKTLSGQEDRLYALSFCQTKILAHAMKFPNVKRIVYSTCSLYAQENEDVVAAAMDYNNNGETEHKTKTVFRVKEALPEWPHRLINPNYEWASKCITASLQEDGTDGFFVAVLEKVKTKRQ